LVTAREEERRRLRRDLHDGLGSVLASLNLRAGAIRSLLVRDPTTAQVLLEEQQATIRTAIADIRRLVYDLRPPSLDELGLAGALRERAAHALMPTGAAIDQENLPQLQITIEAAEDLPSLPAAIEVAAYRIVQEALTNVVRHAHATICLVRLSIVEGSLCVEVTDDGVGIAVGQQAGIGLLSMRERAAEVGGRCSIQPGSTGGTKVCGSFPFPTD
jgi:signal transduction histidine kinase